jgi:serine/threonine protein kinase
MSYCINPSCTAPDKNSSTTSFCLSCGKNILLKDRYRALQLLGQGGFGKTFKAIDEDRPRKPLCVIKQFAYSNADSQTQQVALQLFYEEARHLEALGSHPQIPELLAYFDVEGQSYLVQEFIDGQDSQQELNSNGSFNQQQVRELLTSLLPVLDLLHGGSVPVIHRDLKPANIIRRYSDNQLVLVDFGAAKQATQTILAKTGTKIGSPEYSAPEQIRGKPTFASDIFSLGVTCIHLLTQVSPFDLFDIHSDTWIWRDYLENNPVDQQLGEVLDKMIANSLPLRYQSAIEVLQALNLEQESLAASHPFPDRAARIDLQNAEDYNKRAISKFNQDFSGALADLDKAIELDPELADAYRDRGTLKISEQLKDVSGALADLDKAIKLDPKNSLAYYNRGAVKNLKKPSDISGALADYNKAIELDPKIFFAYINRAQLKHKLSNLKGFKRLKLWAGNYIGRGRVELSDISGALADYSKAIELDPEYADAYYQRGWLKEDKLDNIPGALADYSKAIELNPEFAHAYYNRGKLRKNKIKDSTGAIQDFRRAASLYRQQDGTSKFIGYSITYLQQLGVTE